MKVAIHQPHYFPWMGYFDKMAKSDQFVLLDKVQLEKGSQMIRNRVICDGKIKYLTITADTKDYLSRYYSDILVKDMEVWKNNQLNALKNYYRESCYFSEVYSFVEEFLHNEYLLLCEWTSASIYWIKEILGIETKIIMQSDIDYNNDFRNSDLILDICRSLKADVYVSGKGASAKYLKQDQFEHRGIKIEFQKFIHPVYAQVGAKNFVSGLSILDCLFNMGMKGTKDIFWKGMQS